MTVTFLLHENMLLFLGLITQIHRQFLIYIFCSIEINSAFGNEFSIRAWITSKYFPVPTKNWYLPSASTGIRSLATTATDLLYALKGFQGGDQEWGTALGKTGRTSLQIVRYFQEKILWAKFLHLLISRKALKSLMVTSAPCD